jgi:2-oxoglutarate dehydrogenase E2 component (dihydrolipoamide succinyltransferase)
MTIEVKVPMLPESVADATVLKWHKQPGEAVGRDETLVELETDKVVLEVPAPEAGVLQSVLQAEGVTVGANDVLAVIDKQAEAKLPKNKTAAAAAHPTTSSAVDLSPVVRRLVAEHNLDVTKLTGSGKGGRISKQDVDDYLKRQAKSAAVSTPTVMTDAGARVEKRVPMSRLRSRVAERLVAAQQEAALLTTFNEVNLEAIINLRKRYKDKFEKQHGVRLGFMSFFTRAAIAALKRFPAVNASIDGTDIVYHGYFDIGVAVSTQRGLVVPVLRDADQLTTPQIEAAIVDYATRARDNKLTLEEITGGTFTITNGGVFGSLLSTPIINPPQVGILGMHKIEQRAVVEDNQIVIRPMMYLALTYDHRIIDGKESVLFLSTIKELLEDPARLLLDI